MLKSLNNLIEIYGLEDFKKILRELKEIEAEIKFHEFSINTLCK